MADDERGARRNVVEAIRVTAGHLGNTPKVARSSYVHPAILEAYLDGSIGRALVEAAEEQRRPPAAVESDEEAEVVELLRRRMDNFGHNHGSKAKMAGRDIRSQR